MELLCAAVGYLVVSIASCGKHAGLISYKARNLTYSTTAVSWNTAYATCSSRGGQLITVDNNVTINALKYIRAQPEGALISDNIWMGLHNVAPTSVVPVYVWSDCKDLNENNSMWRLGQPYAVQIARCIVTTSKYTWKTRLCVNPHIFFCENVANVDCTFEKDSGRKCEMDGVPLRREMTEDECATRCQKDMDGNDVCWAYEYTTRERRCFLLFGSDPYMCETLQKSLFVNIGRRRCFTFADITGSEVAASAQSFPNCNKTDVTTSKETQTVIPTTSIMGKTVGASVDTSTLTSRTPGTTVVTSTTLETTITTTTILTTKTATTVMASTTIETTTTTTTTTIPTTTATTTKIPPPTTTTSTTTAIATPPPTTTTTAIPTTSTAAAIPMTTAANATTTIPTTATTATAIPPTTTSTSAVTNNAVTSSVTPTVTTTTSTASSPTAEITTVTRDTDNPTSIPVTSTISTTAHSSSSPGGAFSPSINTFLSRLEAALTSPGSASTPTVTSPGRYVYEVCVAVQTFTVAEREKRTDDIVSDLLLDKKNLSSYRRKKSSAEDDRPSAHNVGGGVAIMLLVTAALIIILPDCSSILMHVVHAHKKKQLVPAQQ